MELELALVSGFALLRQSRPVFLDAHSDFRRCRNFLLGPQRAPRRELRALGPACLLLLHGLLSRLAGHLILREPLLCLAHRFFRAGSSFVSRAAGNVVSRAPRRYGLADRRSVPFYRVEFGPHLPVGSASHSGARPGVLAPGRL